MDRTRRHDEIGDKRPHFARRRERGGRSVSNDRKGAEQAHRHGGLQRPADVVRVYCQLPHQLPPRDAGSCTPFLLPQEMLEGCDEDHQSDDVGHSNPQFPTNSTPTYTLTHTLPLDPMSPRWRYCQLLRDVEKPSRAHRPHRPNGDLHHRHRISRSKHCRDRRVGGGGGLLLRGSRHFLPYKPGWRVYQTSPRQTHEERPLPRRLE